MEVQVRWLTALWVFPGWHVLISQLQSTLQAEPLGEQGKDKLHFIQQRLIMYLFIQQI